MAPSPHPKQQGREFNQNVSPRIHVFQHAGMSCNQEQSTIWRKQVNGMTGSFYAVLAVSLQLWKSAIFGSCLGWHPLSLQIFMKSDSLQRRQAPGVHIELEAELQSKPSYTLSADLDHIQDGALLSQNLQGALHFDQYILRLDNDFLIVPGGAMLPFMGVPLWSLDTCFQLTQNKEMEKKPRTQKKEERSLATQRCWRKIQDFLALQLPSLQMQEIGVQYGPTGHLYEVCELQSCSEDYEHLYTEKRLWADKMVQ